MRNKKRLIFILSSSLVLGSATTLSTVLTSCKKQSEETSAKIVVTGGRNGYANEKIKLNALVVGTESKEVNWTSSNGFVLSVDNEGYVTFLKAGSADIVASLKSDGNVKSTPLTLTCYDSKNATKRVEITSYPKKVSYKVGEAFTLDGIKVMGYLYSDGLKNPNSGVEFNENEVQYSLAEGTVLSTTGRTTVTITVSGYEAASFDIEVNEQLIEKVAFVYKAPTKAYYLENGSATVDFSKLEVRYYTYTDGVKGATATKLRADQYKLSLNNGSQVNAEGNYEVEVTPIDTTIKGTVFTISVYTKDTSIQDLVKALASAENYKYEIKNNVGTTKDTTGFHYVRTVTKDYYDETEYQNVADSTGNITFNYTNVKSHTGYTTYEENGKTGIMSYYEDKLGRIKGGKVIVEEVENGWRERKEAFATLFDKFTVSLLPSTKLNGKFLVTPIEQVAGDDEDGTKTLAKYPLIDEFLSFCGWSGSLITIMTRFTVSLEGANNLNMRAIFGDYGYTEMTLLNVGDASVPKVENAISKSLSPDKTIGGDVAALRSAIYGNNYTVYNYKSKATTAYYTPQYVYYPSDASLNYFEHNGEIHSFTIANDVVTDGGKVTTEATTLPEFMATLDKEGAGYIGNALKPVFGDETDPKRLITVYKYDGFSYGNVVTYQSFDMTILNTYSAFVGGGTLDTTYKFWAMATYEDATRDDPTKIKEIEYWAINSDLRGAVYATRDVGKTRVEAIESYLASLD